MYYLILLEVRDRRKKARFASPDILEKRVYIMEKTEWGGAAALLQQLSNFRKNLTGLSGCEVISTAIL